jgi:hypothetical protein
MGSEEDCISDLPDALRLQIFSPMPLQSATRIDAVSSRWCDPWEQHWNISSLLRIRFPVVGDQLAAIDRHAREGEALQPPRNHDGGQRRGKECSSFRRWRERRGGSGADARAAVASAQWGLSTSSGTRPRVRAGRVGASDSLPSCSRSRLGWMR